MVSLKNVLQSWLGAGVILTLALIGFQYLLGVLLGNTSSHATNPMSFAWGAIIFAFPSTVLNWLYDKQGHERTQRDWMKSPNGLVGKMGYILTGSVALWSLLFLGVLLAILVAGGLASLGQAAWST